MKMTEKRTSSTSVSALPVRKLRMLSSYPDLQIDITVDEVIVASSGDMAMSRNHYSAAFTDSKTSKTVKDNGNAVMILSKQTDGTWKIVREISSPASSPSN
jgi:ketosteroid isomerase-like protein